MRTVSILALSLAVAACTQRSQTKPVEATIVLLEDAKHDCRRSAITVAEALSDPALLVLQRRKEDFEQVVQARGMTPGGISTVQRILATALSPALEARFRAAAKAFESKCADDPAFRRAMRNAGSRGGR